MNVLKMADGLSGLFPQKTILHLLRFQTGELIGKFKVNSELIPESFQRPTQIDVNGAIWRVMKAAIVRDGSYFWKRLVHLYVQEPGNSQSIATHNVPTYAFPSPLPADTALFNEFSVNILPEEWRQLEFVSVKDKLKIKETLKGIENVIDAEDKGTYLRGYDNIFVRESLGQLNLKIPFEDFCTVIKDIQEKGNVIMGGELVQDAFALRTNDHTYYGIIRNGIIMELALEQFDYMDWEINEVLERFGLIFAIWCDPRILMFGNEEEAQEQPLVGSGDII